MDNVGDKCGTPTRDNTICCWEVTDSNDVITSSGIVVCNADNVYASQTCPTGQKCHTDFGTCFRKCIPI